MIETFSDILEELADMFGVYGAEIRNDWIIKMRRRIEIAIKIEGLLSNEKARIPYVLKHMPIIDDPAISEALADLDQ